MISLYNSKRKSSTFSHLKLCDANIMQCKCKCEEKSRGQGWGYMYLKYVAYLKYKILFCILKPLE